MRPFIDFVKERTYLKNVSPRTIEFYWDCHKSAFRFGEFTEGGLKRWIIRSREAGISAASVNTRITGINACLRWTEMGCKLEFLKMQARIFPTLIFADLTELIQHSLRCRSRRQIHTLVLTFVGHSVQI